MPNMNYQDAYDVLVSRVYAPVFFAKLAQYDIHPQTQEQAVYFLKMAGKLRNAHELETVKSANQHTDLLAGAEQSLDNLLASYGYQTPDNDAQTKEAADLAFNQPYVGEAASVFNEYLASLQNQN